MSRTYYGSQSPYVERRKIKKHQLFDSHYDAHLACSLCECYQNGSCDDNKVLNELLAQTAPLIGMVARTQIGFRTCDYDVVRGEALEKLFFLFKKQEVPTTTPRRFTAFLYTILYRAMINSIRKGPPYIYDYWLICDEPTTARLPTHEDTERKLHYQQLRDLIRSVAVQEIRFRGKEKQACEYILSCLMEYISLKPMSVQFKYKLSKARATKLVQYCNILLKRITYEVQELESEDT